MLGQDSCAFISVPLNSLGMDVAEAETSEWRAAEKNAETWKKEAECQSYVLWLICGCY